VQTSVGLAGPLSEALVPQIKHSLDNVRCRDFVVPSDSLAA
jgi:hypothetical protein